AAARLVPGRRRDLDLFPAEGPAAGEDPGVRRLHRRALRGRALRGTHARGSVALATGPRRRHPVVAGRPRRRRAPATGVGRLRSTTAYSSPRPIGPSSSSASGGSGATTAPPGAVA